MKNKYQAVVVGGGLAGLTSAAYLCRYGFQTLVCEKRGKTGGLVDTFWHQGFAFDGGIRAFENSGIVFPLLKDLGIEMECKQNQVSIGIADQSDKLTSKDSLDNYMSMLTTIFPENMKEINEIKEEVRKVMGYMDVLYGIDNPLFMEKMDSEYLTNTLLPWFFRYQLNIRKASRLDEPIQSYLRRFTKNIALIDMITQHFFKDTPTFFALSYFSLYLDYSYPIGGTGTLAEKMTKYIQVNGGDILTETEVSQINAKEHQILLGTGETIGYGKLIWAADQKTLYKQTNYSGISNFEKQKALTQKGIGGDSILTVFLGVNQSEAYFEARCGAHMFYTPSTEGLSSIPDWKESSNDNQNDLFRWTEEYLERTTFEISCPVLRDKTLAPEGKTGLIISTLLDYSLVKRISEDGNYERFKELCTQKIINVLEQSLFPGIQENILFTICATPLTIERETFNSEGAITGWSFTNEVIPSENQFKKITKAVQTPIPDVYQCGQWTFSPSGLPVSIITGKLAADQVKKNKNNKVINRRKLLTE